MQRGKVSAVCYHLLNSNYALSFKDFSVLCNENKKYLLEQQERVSKARERSSMNRNIRSIILFSLCLSLRLNEFLSHCLLHFVEFCNQFLIILHNFLDLRKSCKCWFLSTLNGWMINRRNLFKTLRVNFFKNWIYSKVLSWYLYIKP